MLARAPARIDRPTGTMYGNRMTLAAAGEPERPMKMAAARNTSAGAVFPVPAGTSSGIAAMASAHHHLDHVAPAAARPPGRRA